MASAKKPTLAALVAAAQRGDTVAFTRFIEAVTPVVYRLAFRTLGSEAEASDIVQETSIKVWASLSSLRDRDAALAWVCRIARNLCTDHIRAHKRRLSEPDAAALADTLARIKGGELDPATLVESAEACQNIMAMIDALGERHRVVLLLHGAEQMSNDEIAAALGIPIGTVESRLTRARRKLADKLERAARRDARREASGDH